MEKKKNQTRRFRIQFKCFFFLIHQESENVSVFKKKSPNLHKVLFSCWFFCFLFIPAAYIFSSCLETEKERKRTPCWTGGSSTEELLREEISSVEESTSLSLRKKLEIILRTEEGGWISRWISDRPFSSDRLCTTCLSSPCRTPFGTSLPPHGVSCFLV